VVLRLLDINCLRVLSKSFAGRKYLLLDLSSHAAFHVGARNSWVYPSRE
jgi:hypothetical protein